VENSHSLLSIYGCRPTHPAYSPSSSPCCTVNSHPVSFLYSRGRSSSSPQQAGECAKLLAPPPSLRLRGTNLPPSSSRRCRSNRGLHSLLPQRVIFPSPQRRRGLSHGDRTQPEQGELVQAASLHNYRGYFCLFKAPLTFEKKLCLIIFWGGCPAGAAAVGAGMPYQQRQME
jgi:hypothetical protein